MFQVNWCGKKDEFFKFNDAYEFLISTDEAGDIWFSKNGELKLTLHRAKNSRNGFDTTWYS